MNDLKSTVPSIRVRDLNDGGVQGDGDYILYWMTAYRRTRSNFALQRAAEWSRQLAKPLVVLSAVRLDYRWATDRAHAFILDSMADVEAGLAGTNAIAFSYVEQGIGDGKGLLYALADRAAVVVADDAPIFFLPKMTAAAAGNIDVLVEGVDHNGLLPLATTDRVFHRAYDLRRYLQAELSGHLDDDPAPQPLAGLPRAESGLLDDIRSHWPSPVPDRTIISNLELDHGVPALESPGGQQAAQRLLTEFVEEKLDRYGDRNHPDEQVTSGLSPYLHFGNVSPHDVFLAIVDHEGWNPGELSEDTSGKRSGWWGMSDSAEGFLDQLVTWRELGYRSARYVPGNDDYSALPEWARETLAAHAGDQREFVYTLEEFDAAETHDELWNAAQRQLRHEGIIHNYMRMLWGKKIIEWTRDPEEAHDVMFELNNRYALDGRDPNSTSGIHWVLGRYDRPWGPEREIFGKVRYMSSESTRRKLHLKEYLGQSKMLNT